MVYLFDSKIEKRFFLLLVFLFTLFCLVPVSFAQVTSYVVKDTLTPEGHNALYVNSTEVNRGVKYSVVLQPGNYSLSFLYRVEAGGFYYTVDTGDNTESSGTLIDNDYTLESFSFEILGADTPVTIHFLASESASVWFLDALTLEPSKAPTVYLEDNALGESVIYGFNDFRYTQGCCPADFCYTGRADSKYGACVHDDWFEKDVTTPPLGFTLSDFGVDLSPSIQLLNGRGGYRCINGTWKYSPIKFTPIMDEAAFCPDASQCFIGTDAGVDSASACVDNGVWDMYPVKENPGPSDYQSFYCYDGNWTTRTKEVALQLLNMTDGTKKYTLFCDSFDRSLNSDYLGFSYRDFFGKDIYQDLDSYSTNEFCVLDLDGQIIVGTSLNFAINKSRPEGCNPVDTDNCGKYPETSFIYKLKGDKTYCDNVFEMSDAYNGFYHPCGSGDVYYNPSLETVLFVKPYSLGEPQTVPIKDELSFIGDLWQSMKDFVRSLLGIAGITKPLNEDVIAGEFDFIKNAGSFNRLYLSFDPTTGDLDKEIKGIVETRASIFANQVDIKNFMSIDYLNYRVPICKYFYQHNLPDLQEQISALGSAGIRCTPVILDDNDWKYSVYVEEPRFQDIPSSYDDRRDWSRNSADVFWNDMTAKLRSKEVPQSENPATPSTPVIMTAPADNVVADWPVDFYLENPGDDIIAMTWDFGDGAMASSAYNVSTPHEYKRASDDPYTASVRVMNSDYVISAVATTDVTVKTGDAVSIDLLDQPYASAAQIQLHFNQFTQDAGVPVSLDVHWGDDSETNIFNYDASDPSTPLILTHEYEVPFGRTSFNPVVSVSGSASVPFDNHKKIVVERYSQSADIEVNITQLPQTVDANVALNISVNTTFASGQKVTVDWRDYLNSSYEPVEYDTDPSQSWLVVNFTYTMDSPQMVTDVLVSGHTAAHGAFVRSEQVAVKQTLE